MEGSSLRVVSVGAGFGGLKAAKILGGHEGPEILVIDRKNHHLFQPLLYQVAMAGLSPAEIAVPVRSLLSHHRNIRVLLGTVQDVLLQEKRIHTDFGSVTYDYLMLACGSEQSYFGHDEWERYAPGLKTLEQATDIRRRGLVAFENAEREPDPELQKEFLTFVVIGGGPTGVELAGALGELSRYTLSRDFRNIDPRRTRVILVEAGPRILARFPLRLTRRAAKDVEGLGVQIRTSSRVNEVTERGVQVGTEVLRASTILWAAGMRSSPLNQSLQEQGIPLDRAGRVRVQADLSLRGFPEVFVVGDQACVEIEQGKPLPGLAPVAIQEGRSVARNIIRESARQDRVPFRYRDKGQMAKIGRKSAIVDTRRFQFCGALAWVFWLVIHIYYLIGFKKRLFVFLQWGWAYMTLQERGSSDYLSDHSNRESTLASRFISYSNYRAAIFTWLDSCSSLLRGEHMKSYEKGKASSWPEAKELPDLLPESHGNLADQAQGEIEAGIEEKVSAIRRKVAMLRPWIAGNLSAKPC